MPTSLWEIAIYVFALFPGVAFIFAREGHRPAGKRSAIRETATVVFVSTLCDAALALVLTVLASFLPGLQELLVQLVRGDFTFVAENLVLATFSATVALILATLLGYLLGSQWAHEHGLSMIWKAAIPRDSSAWTQLLHPDQKVVVQVALTLRSGAWISGMLANFDDDPDPHPHRAMLLNGEILMRAAGDDEVAVIDADWLVIEAGDIEMLQVTHSLPNAGQTVEAESVTPSSGRRERAWGLLTVAGFSVLIPGSVVQITPSTWIIDAGALLLGLFGLGRWLNHRRRRTQKATASSPSSSD
ncbi:DUF6338 family protein [Rathayibacter sp. VKM Ac-2801]|uniref:DUF6338 family protein n=1 Tax=Rathayibacter sp. VKM Ac-2801 TaxID=2609255 RepID=UPI00132051B6|nr:DUF6338 family protein [Rathayibacter sp. VKM Ac-2801]QHC71786.1 hypothetical protein GSU45_16255 [Rathayibacter sp. VKM Ac-2801]